MIIKYGWTLPIIVCLFIALLLTRSPENVDITQKIVPQVVGEFRTKNYDVSDHEHVVVFDIPNRVFPTRCWTYVNEKTGTSNMQCDPTDDSSAPPIMGQTLDR